MSITPTQIDAFARFLDDLQRRITDALAAEDGQPFRRDVWQRDGADGGLRGHGVTMVLKNGAVIEQGGVNVSVVHGATLPAVATEKRPQLAGCAFSALGLSLVIHPRNPYVPTSHANIRLFVARDGETVRDWWFGGGFDLTVSRRGATAISTCRTVARRAVSAAFSSMISMSCRLPTPAPSPRASARPISPRICPSCGRGRTPLMARANASFSCTAAGVTSNSTCFTTAARILACKAAAAPNPS